LNTKLLKFILLTLASEEIEQVGTSKAQMKIISWICGVNRCVMTWRRKSGKLGTNNTITVVQWNRL